MSPAPGERRMAMKMMKLMSLVYRRLDRVSVLV